MSPWLGVFFFGLLGILSLTEKRKFSRISGLVLFVFASSLFVSCGGGSSGPQPNPNGTPAGSYIVTVSALGDSNMPQSTKIGLIVN